MAGLGRATVQPAVSDLVEMEGRMRKLLIIFALTLLPSFAMAHGHGGGGGHKGGWGGGHEGGRWGGGQMRAAWGGRRRRAMTGRWSRDKWHGRHIFHPSLN